MTVPSNNVSSNGQSEDMDIDQQNGNPAKKQKLISKEDLEKVMDDIEKRSLNVDEKWYLISLKWWRKVEKVLEDGFIEDITSIDNSNISRKGISGAFYLAPSLVEKMDFIPVPESSFEILKDSFGVEDEKRDIIERVVIKDKLRGNTLEIYPKIVHVVLARDRSKNLTLHLRNDTVGSLRERALKELGVDVPLNRIRFFVEHGDRMEWLKDIKDDDDVSTLFSSEPTIAVDVLDEDGRGFVSTKSTIDSATPLLARMYRLSINFFLWLFPEQSFISFLIHKFIYTPNNARTLSYLYRYENDDSWSSTPRYTRGVCGLSNLGNTCFMASAVQCLSNVPEITEYFLTDQYLTDLNVSNPLGTEGHLAKVYGHLMKDMWSGRQDSIVPRNFKSVIGKFAPRFSGYAQQDSQELLAFLLDGLHEDLNRIKEKPYVEERDPPEGMPQKEIAEEAWTNYKKRNDSIIVDKVHGQLRSTLVCPQCSKISIKFDPFCFLSVPVPAKEHIFRMKFVVLFNPTKKWAKFSLGITRSTTVADAAALISESLGEKIELVMFTVDVGGKARLYESSQPIAERSKYETIYAWQVKLPVKGNELVIANTVGEHRLKTLPIMFTIPGGSSEESVKEFADHEVIPFVKDVFMKKSLIKGSDDEAEKEEEMEEINEKCETEVKKSNEGWIANLSFEDTSILEDLRGSGLIEREKSVPEPKQDVALIDCINLFTREEQLSEQDSWYCPNCKEHVRAMKKLDIWKLPQILIVHLKRFQYSRWSREKIDTAVAIPGKDFHLRDILANDSHEDTIYDLIAISHHMGGLGGGHYTAGARNGDTWYYFNDAHASKASPPYGSPSSSPYMLVYRRRDSPIVHEDGNLEMETED
ncbi:hypothetical protein PMAYCL1PPCAC_17729 [Pristionchus mayeri]|uniref:Ubiquitin carboxyl-terminal hydrolase n=1 Tax=Pristionchus mayeri TaxID=1317129 RepID=A0AAN5I0R2_9BILA|nr:hypothetical protein PMAYCL1PPCAC_17729 [Pristionchus mayeri]